MNFLEKNRFLRKKKKRSKLTILFLLLLFTSISNAQVINIESRRFLHDTDGWVGKVEANFSAVQNIQQVITVGCNVHAQYQKNRHRFLEISDLAFVKAGNKDFVNSGYQHFRYNYKINNWITGEAFVQAQYNKALLLDERYLAGAGPRFKLWKREHFRCYFAALYMYEYEWRNNYKIENENDRLSSYLSFSLFYPKFDITSTTFYQPNLGYIDDYRIANDTSLEILLTNKFNFKMGLILLYDTRQPPGVPDLTYAVRNGISYKF
jgi:putative salt-induced outer membrane protein YdiY